MGYVRELRHPSKDPVFFLWTKNPTRAEICDRSQNLSAARGVICHVATTICGALAGEPRSSQRRAASLAKSSKSE